MILFLSELDFENFNNEKDNKISNFYKLKGEMITRPPYGSQKDDDTSTTFIIKEFLNPSLPQLEPVYKKNKKIKSIKCLDDSTYKCFIIKNK